MPVSTRQSSKRSDDPTSTSSAGAESKTGFNAYNITTPLLVFFAITHTIGGVFKENDFGPAANAIMKAMKTEAFVFYGAHRTLHDFHKGFGLGCTIFLTMSAALSWVLSRSSNKGHSEVLKPVKWILFLSHVANTALCFMYFFIPPMVVSTVLAGLLGWECLN